MPHPTRSCWSQIKTNILRKQRDQGQTIRRVEYKFWTYLAKHFQYYHDDFSFIDKVENWHWNDEMKEKKRP